MAMSLDNLALFADFLYGRLYFHCDFHLSVFLAEDSPFSGFGASILHILLKIRRSLFLSSMTLRRTALSFRFFGILPTVEMQTVCRTELRSGHGSLETSGVPSPFHAGASMISSRPFDPMCLSQPLI